MQSKESVPILDLKTPTVPTRLRKTDAPIADTDWEKITRFSKNTRFQPLVQHFQQTGNKPITFQELIDKSLLGVVSSPSYTSMLNIDLKRAGLPYAVRVVKSAVGVLHSWTGSSVKFVVLKA